jgi:VanZ family protein
VTPDHTRGWRLATAAYAGVVLLGAVLPIEVPGPKGLGLDTLAHLGEYLLFAWLLARTAPSSLGLVRSVRWWAWGVATGYGAGLELVQGLLPWRSADVMDAGMNGLGALLGVIVSKRGV